MDGDKSKQVGIKASTSGVDYTKADISLRLPSDFQVSSEITVNQGNTIFDGKTDISYSRDTSKTLTLFSRVQNFQGQQSGFFGGLTNSNDNFNYSVEFGIRHPVTKTDIKLDSHLAMSDDSVTSSLGLHYLTNRRQMKNLALWAEIDSLKREINLVTGGLETNHQLHGKVVSWEPLRVELNKLSDDRVTLSSTLDVNTEQQSLQLDAGIMDSTFTIRAFYPNDTTFLADIIQRKSGIYKEDAVVSVRLMTPHLLHTRVHWDPQVFKRLRLLVNEELIRQKQQLRKNLLETAVAAEVEIVSKYGLLMMEVYDGLKPTMRSVQEELESLEDEMRRTIDTFQKMHRNNEFYLKDLTSSLTHFSSAYNSLIVRLSQLKEDYREKYTSVVQMMADRMEDMKNYPMGEHIRQSLSDTRDRVTTHLDNVFTSTMEQLSEIDARLLDFRGKTQNMLTNARTIYSNNPHLQALTTKLNELRNISYGSYISRAQQSVKDKLNYLGVNHLHKIPLMVVKVIPTSVRQTVEETSNEVYQQAVWAYNYWDVEQTTANKLHSLIKILEKIIKAELKEYFHDVIVFFQNPITTFDPAHGEIDADVRLPFKIHNLKQISEYVEMVRKAIKLIEKLLWRPQFPHASQYVSTIINYNNTDLDLEPPTVMIVQPTLDDDQPSIEYLQSSVLPF
jgi:hypothetical protein